MATKLVPTKLTRNAATKNHFFSLPLAPVCLIPHHREEASVQAEECASRALSSASRAAEATDLRLRAMSDKLEAKTV